MKNPFVFLSLLTIFCLAAGKTAYASVSAGLAVLYLLGPIANAYVLYALKSLEVQLAKLDAYIFKKSLRIFGGIKTIEGEYRISFPMKNFPDKRECDVLNEKHDELIKHLAGAVVEVYGEKAKMDDHFKVDSFITIQGEKRLVQKVVPKSEFGKKFLTAVVNERLRKNLPLNIYRD
jgi:hypothetical protein